MAMQIVSGALELASDAIIFFSCRMVTHVQAVYTRPYFFNN